MTTLCQLASGCVTLPIVAALLVAGVALMLVEWVADKVQEAMAQ